MCAVLAALGLAAAPAAAAADAAPAADTSRPAPASTPIRGGDVLYTAGGWCAVSFNARGGARNYAAMPSGCGQVGTQWFADSQQTVPVAVTVTTTPAYTLIRYTSSDFTYPPEINAGGTVITVNQVINPAVGQQVCRFGSSTGWLCGTVQALNQTVNYPQGTVYGLIRTTMCPDPYSRGAVLASGRLVGVVVGGSGSCISGGTTFVLPAVQILSVHGLMLG
ncbi:hypothetical protein GCM10009716_22750 [Streptomyces sodiiphilus]|uniref:Streptogrisin B n=2 Tax=Streptomyces sodiiphilus TaxID=226217 RepID=A0ABP5AFZ3_9ACTN